jgi:hypothetical protein
MPVMVAEEAKRVLAVENDGGLASHGAVAVKEAQR